MDKWRRILNDFRGCSDRLESAVVNLTNDQVDQVPENGGWTPRQIIHHLADGSCLWGMFIHQALSGKGGEFNLHWYWDIPQEEWAEIWKYSTREIGPSLNLYRANQERLLTLLEQIENPGHYTAEIKIRENPPESVSIRDAVHIQILHLKEHLADIRAILKK